MRGPAVDYTECPNGGGHGWCKCGKCVVCGFQKHTAVHGPYYKPPDFVTIVMESVGHEYKPR